MRARALWTVGVLGAIASCAEPAEPRPQWTVVVSSDAAVPVLGDRVLVEVLTQQGQLACEGCRRVFGVADRRALPLSFGIADTPSGELLRVRARLYRSSLGHDLGIDRAIAAIDVVGRLPKPEGLGRVSLRLPMACFGVAPDLAARESCDAGTGALAEERVLGGTSSAPVLETASWAPLEERPCTSAAPNGMSCIPGGAFLLGDTQSIAGNVLAPPSVPERLVRLDPFFLDKTELSVGEYRKLVTQAAIPPAAILSPAPNQGCTYLGQTDPANDELPLNCLDQHQATLLCEASSKRLPTEAEWEFAASGRGLELRYPWGDDDDVCAHAVVARSGLDGVATCMVLVGDVSAGVTPVGSWHDVSRDGILDLGGNVSEWVADGSAKYDAACFLPAAQLLENPLCAPATDQIDFAVRGGNFTTIPSAARASTRFTGVSPGYPNVGVRCARSN